MKVKEVLKLNPRWKDVPVVLARSLAIFQMYMSADAVPERYLDMEVSDHEYLSEGDGNIRHDTLWIELEG